MRVAYSGCKLYCFGDVSDGDPHNKKKRTRADCQRVNDKLIAECNAKCTKKYPPLAEDWGDACKKK